MVPGLGAWNHENENETVPVDGCAKMEPKALNVVDLDIG